MGEGDGGGSEEGEKRRMREWMTKDEPERRRLTPSAGCRDGLECHVREKRAPPVINYLTQPDPPISGFCKTITQDVVLSAENLYPSVFRKPSPQSGGFYAIYSGAE